MPSTGNPELDAILQLMSALATVQQQQQQAAQIADIQAKVEQVVLDDRTMLTDFLQFQAASYLLLNTINFEVQQILGQLAALQGRGVTATLSGPVTLPATPPPGYGGAATSDIASAVWQYSAIEASVQTQEALSRAGSLAENWTGAAIAAPVSWAPFIGATPAWNSFSQGPWSPTDLQALNLHSLIASTSTILAYANAQLPTYAWVEDSDGHVRSYFPRGSGVIYTWLITDDDLAVYRALASGSAARVPPVWPGIGQVTLGAVHALADGLVVAGPLDGLIVKVTGVSPPVGYYPFGARKSFVHVGAVVFVDDNGEGEWAIQIGLDDQVVTPMHIQHPASAVFRVKSGVTGTVQPWTLV